ncbi:MAG TPA: TonB-dependent receptor [Candidatus Elarobacter sp.]|nr:TonB-dependent receptor [Candidatus Elarobacter sp.]
MQTSFFVKRLAPAALSLALVVPSFLGLGSPASAQGAAPGSIAGTVVSADGAPVPGASVVLQGAATASTASGRDGRFSFANVSPGTYTIVVSKAGFAQTQQQDVFVVAGSATAVNAVLTASSFSSLQQIGHVSTNNAGRATINTTPAAVNVISNQVFVDQGALQVIDVLNQTPGVVSFGGGGAASLGSSQETQIRGALPYETESLIDGHPVSVGSDGSFSPTFLNPAMLQDVEVVKGPGSMPTDINYAIGGSVNYRTLEPTRTPRETLTIGGDGFGGVSTAFQATGSLPGHKIDYAFAYATNGTPGPLVNDRFSGSSIPLAYGDLTQPYYINGQQVVAAPYGVAASGTPQYTGVIGGARLVTPIYTCCPTIDSGYVSRNELAKLRYNFSEQTALTISYLGGQEEFGQDGVQSDSVYPIYGSNQGEVYFAPPAGYAGSVPAGRVIPAALTENLDARTWQQQNLVQAELHTALGASNTLLARFYTGYTNDYVDESPGKLDSPYSWTENAWGGVPLCPVGTLFGAGGCAPGGVGAGVAPTMTYFNGQPTTFTRANLETVISEQDYLQGESLELDHVAGPNTYVLAIDRSHHAASAVGGVTPLTPGSGQLFTTISGRAQLVLTSKLNASVSDYAVTYASHYTGDGGITWHDATHTVNEPRAALTFRPSADTALRFSAGGSIAPPYIQLLSSPGSTPLANTPGAATAYTENTNNGQVSPETAFGYDLGVDQRLPHAMSFSADLFETTLHNMFLPSTFLVGTYTPPAGSLDAGNTEGLYVSQTENLGQARFEGVEFSFQRTPIAGLGFRLQGSLERAFTFGLPPGFYDTGAAGPYTTNLGIIPYVNFQTTGTGFNALNTARIPYATGYGELNYRTRGGAYYSLGATYFGSNNAFNVPAFTVFSGSVRYTLAKNTTLQVSASNLFGVNDSALYGGFNGIPVALANGAAHVSGGFGYLGPVGAVNYGPSIVTVQLRHTFGGP